MAPSRSPAPAYSNLISPFITAFEVEADYLAGDTADAEHLLHLTWDQMIDPRNPFFTGGMWENIGPDGTATESRTSLAHGWASGPTPIMISYVLGVQPVAPGYQTFTVAPHFGSLRWAEGAVPTPYGRIFVRWNRDGHRFSVTVAVPPQATAFVDLPDGHNVTVPGGRNGTERTFARLRLQSHEELLAKLSLDEKVSLLTGADYWTLRGHPGIGLRPVRTSDGPAGVRGTQWDERDTALNVPAPVALAATWDPRRAELIGSLLAAECRRKNVDVLLAPTVNLQRSPFGGRNFEFLGEDPLLTGVIGAALVRGLQRGGVAATVKHFVANDSETERFTVDNRLRRAGIARAVPGTLRVHRRAGPAVGGDGRL